MFQVSNLRAAVFFDLLPGAEFGDQLVGLKLNLMHPVSLADRGGAASNCLGIAQFEAAIASQ